MSAELHITVDSTAVEHAVAGSPEPAGAAEAAESAAQAVSTAAREQPQAATAIAAAAAAAAPAAAASVAAKPPANPVAGQVPPRAQATQELKTPAPERKKQLEPPVLSADDVAQMRRDPNVADAVDAMIAAGMFTQAEPAPNRQAEASGASGAGGTSGGGERPDDAARQQAQKEIDHALWRERVEQAKRQLDTAYGAAQAELEARQMLREQLAAVAEARQREAVAVAAMTDDERVVFDATQAAARQATLARVKRMAHEMRMASEPEYAAAEQAKADKLAQRKQEAADREADRLGRQAHHEKNLVEAAGPLGGMVRQVIDRAKHYAKLYDRLFGPATPAPAAAEVPAAPAPAAAQVQATSAPTPAAPPPTEPEPAAPLRPGGMGNVTRAIEPTPAAPAPTEPEPAAPLRPGGMGNVTRAIEPTPAAPAPTPTVPEGGQRPEWDTGNAEDFANYGYKVARGAGKFNTPGVASEEDMARARQSTLEHANAQFEKLLATAKGGEKVLLGFGGTDQTWDEDKIAYYRKYFNERGFDFDKPVVDRGAIMSAKLRKLPASQPTPAAPPPTEPEPAAPLRPGGMGNVTRAIEPTPAAPPPTEPEPAAPLRPGGMGNVTRAIEPTPAAPPPTEPEPAAPLRPGGMGNVTRAIEPTPAATLAPGAAEGAAAAAGAGAGAAGAGATGLVAAGTAAAAALAAPVAAIVAVAAAAAGLGAALGEATKSAADFGAHVAREDPYLLMDKTASAMNSWWTTAALAIVAPPVALVQMVVGPIVEQATAAVHQLADAVHSTADRLAEYSGVLSVQQAQHEVRDITREMQRAQRFEGDVSQANEARYNMEAKLSEITDRFMPLVMTVSTGIFKLVEGLAEMLDELLKGVLEGVDGGVQALDWMVSHWPFGGVADLHATLEAMHLLLRRMLEPPPLADTPIDMFLGMGRAPRPGAAPPMAPRRGGMVRPGAAPGFAGM